MKKLTCNISQKYFEQCIPKIHQVRILNLLFLKFTQYLKVSLCVVMAMVPLLDQTIMDGLRCRDAANIEEELYMEMVPQQGDFQVHLLQGGPFGSQE